ncbi:MAG: hypothetical protein ACTS73_00550 [Arsenophonus sp. NEOnobi-MAG3]
MSSGVMICIIEDGRKEEVVAVEDTYRESAAGNFLNAVRLAEPSGLNRVSLKLATREGALVFGMQYDKDILRHAAH